MGQPKDPFQAAEEAWWQGFLEKLKLPGMQLGRKALARLCGAGLGTRVRMYLYAYHLYYQDGATNEISLGLAKINSRTDKLKYADGVARDRRNDPGAAKFTVKREKAARKRAETPWPFHDEEVKTFADAEKKYPATIGSLPIQEFVAVMGNARQACAGYGAKPILAILRAVAEARGVDLSLNELVQLADGAHASDPPLDKNTLQRFLKYGPIRLIEDTSLATFKKSFSRVNWARP